MSEIKQELFDLLATQTPEVIAELRRRVLAGQIDGSIYISNRLGFGPCGCIYGTIAIANGFQTYNASACAFIGNLTDQGPDPDDWYRTELERFVASIYVTDTPTDNDHLADILAWIDDYTEARAHE